MNKTLVLFLAFVVVVSAGMGFSTAADNKVDDITADSANQNLQDQVIVDPSDPSDPKTIPMQKTGVPFVAAMLSTLLIGSGLLYGRLRN